MQATFHYESLSVALEELRQRGFTIDLNVKENQVQFKGHLEVVDVYRYEGDSDPADEATVYAIQSAEGAKGVLVTGYGFSSDPLFDQVVRLLR